MESDLIEVQLSVEIKNETVIAHLFFQNKSERIIYLNKQLIYDDGIVRNNYFEIINGNNEADYLGIMANCIKEPEEFVELGPGEKIDSSIPLNEYYGLIKGYKYSIQYSAFNPSFSEDQQLMHMESNKVEISY